jgi:CheY-like chemotaxis protein
MIVDFNMHSMNGIEFSKEAKRLLSKNVPILLLTAVNMENETYSSDDISCILYKPIKSQSLSAKILEYLQVKEKGQNKTSSDFDSLLASRNPLKILVVEDNPVNVRVICHLLKKFGYQADVSSDGMEAFDSVKRQHYDLVLMDVEMPVLDGIDATVKIRNELPDDKQPIIVALTANVEVDTKNRVIEAGMNGCITKPVQIQELSNLLNKTKPGYKLYGSDEILDSGLVEFVDRERVHEFEKLDASEDLIMETLLNGFGEHLSSMIGNLKLALVSKDKEAFLSDLYTLKSSSGDVGLTVLYNQLETIGHLFDDDNHWPSEEQIDALSITGQQTYNYLVENGWVRPDFKW